MDTNFSISIKSSCSEHSGRFDKTKTDRLFNSRQKEVIDFRYMSDDRLLQYLERNTGRYFKNSQFNRVMVHSKSKQRHFKLAKVFALVVFLFLSLHSIQAQDNTKTTNSEVVEAKLLKGIVTTESGPLAGANVILKNSSIGVTTDFEGRFKFPIVLKEGHILIVNYIGYKPQKFIIAKDQKFLEVALTSDDIDLMGAVEVKKVYKSKR